MRCCGRISCFRILHLLSPKTGTTKKSSLCQRRTSILTDYTRTGPDVCFVTNLRLSHHTTFTTVTRSARRSCTELPAPLIGFVKTQHDPETRVVMRSGARFAEGVIGCCVSTIHNLSPATPCDMDATSCDLFPCPGRFRRVHKRSGRTLFASGRHPPIGVPFIFARDKESEPRHMYWLALF